MTILVTTYPTSVIKQDLFQIKSAITHHLGFMVSNMLVGARACRRWWRILGSSTKLSISSEKTISERYFHLGFAREAGASLDNVIYRVRPRKEASESLPAANAQKGQIVPRSNNHLVNEVVRLLNDTVYLEELPERLSRYSDQLLARDVAMILKLVRDVRLAFGFFNWAKEQEGCSLNLDVFLTMVHRLLVARKWDNLNQVVDWMHEKNFYLDYGLFEAVIKESSDALRADVCEKWYKLMHEINVRPNVFIYNLMIRVYNKDGRHKDALKVFQDMEENKVKPTVVTYSQLFSVCKDMGDPEIANVLLKKMKLQGIQPDRMAYTSLMNVYAKAGQPEAAAALFKAMQDRGIAPDVFLFNCLLEAYVRANMLDKALSVFNDLLSSGSSPNEATYVIMLGLYCKTGLYDKAAELLKTVDHNSIKLGEQFFMTLVKAYAGAERWDDTISVFNEMQASSCRIRGSIYVLMLEVCFKAGYYEACEEFFDAILNKGVNRTPAVYETMIKAYERMDKLSHVTHLFTYMQDMLCPFTPGVYDLLHEIFTRTRNSEMLEKLEGIKKAGKIIVIV